ncbi:unnamed protein product [Pedinophyceae sp. YPF-701]|nr:unnamed protein product [Pedinophyceae sp. YPF-701]
MTELEYPDTLNFNEFLKVLQAMKAYESHSEANTLFQAVKLNSRGNAVSLNGLEAVAYLFAENLKPVYDAHVQAAAEADHHRGSLDAPRGLPVASFHRMILASCLNEESDLAEPPEGAETFLPEQIEAVLGKLPLHGRAGLPRPMTFKDFHLALLFVSEATDVPFHVLASAMRDVEPARGGEADEHGDAVPALLNDMGAGMRGLGRSASIGPGALARTTSGLTRATPGLARTASGVSRSGPAPSLARSQTIASGASSREMLRGGGSKRDGLAKTGSRKGTMGAAGGPAGGVRAAADEASEALRAVGQKVEAIEQVLASRTTQASSRNLMAGTSVRSMAAAGRAASSRMMLASGGSRRDGLPARSSTMRGTTMAGRAKAASVAGAGAGPSRMSWESRKGGGSAPGALKPSEVIDIDGGLAELFGVLADTEYLTPGPDQPPLEDGTYLPVQAFRSLLEKHGLELNPYWAQSVFTTARERVMERGGRAGPMHYGGADVMSQEVFIEAVHIAADELSRRPQDMKAALITGGRPDGLQSMRSMSMRRSRLASGANESFGDGSAEETPPEAPPIQGRQRVLSYANVTPTSAQETSYEEKLRERLRDAFEAFAASSGGGLDVRAWTVWLRRAGLDNDLVTAMGDAAAARTIMDQVGRASTGSKLDFGALELACEKVASALKKDATWVREQLCDA